MSEKMFQNFWVFELKFSSASVFETKFSKGVRFWFINFKTRRILDSKKATGKIWSVKILQRVGFWKKSNILKEKKDF